MDELFVAVNMSGRDKTHHTCWGTFEGSKLSVAMIGGEATDLIGAFFREDRAGAVEQPSPFFH